MVHHSEMKGPVLPDTTAQRPCVVCGVCVCVLRVWEGTAFPRLNAASAVAHTRTPNP